MEQSILRSTKKKLNVDPDDTSFDTDLIDYINTAFSHLLQLGVGPQAGYQIEDDQATWSDFLPDEEDMVLLNFVKTSVQLHTRMLFDPPDRQVIADAINRQIEQCDFHIGVIRESRAWMNPDPAVMIIDGGDPSGE